jgi:hypothetical protein
MTEANLPTVAAAKGNIATLAGGAEDAGIMPAIEVLITNLARSETHYDDVYVSLHCETTLNGSRSVFSYKACRL